MSHRDDVILARFDAVLRREECFGPVADDRIATAEAELAVSFPRSYRLFLRTYGAAVGERLEIAGLPDTRASDVEPPFWTNVIDETLQVRRTWRGELTPGYVPIAHDGTDHTFYLATRSVGSDGECPVLVFGTGLDDTEAAPSFVDWVERAGTGRRFPSEGRGR